MGGDTNVQLLEWGESKQTSQRHSIDIISEHEHASCVTHECHLLQFKTLRAQERHKDTVREEEKEEEETVTDKTSGRKMKQICI